MNAQETLVRLDNRIASEPVAQVIKALNEGRIQEAMTHFADEFIFTDNGLGLYFDDRAHLQEFFEKTRELYPDLSIRLVSVFRIGDNGAYEWTLQNTVSEAGFGNLRRKVPVSLRGVSIVQVQHGRITRWVDYYDGLTARRTALGAYFTEWVEL